MDEYIVYFINSVCYRYSVYYISVYYINCILYTVYIQAVHQKDTQEDDIKIMNKNDLAAIIQFKTHLYI